MTPINNDKINYNKISDDLICMTAMNATLSVDGVHSMSDTLTDNLSKIISGQQLFNGLRLSKDKEELVIDVFVIVEFGHKIPQIAWDIQSSVKQAVEKITTNKVKEVNIHVQGVSEKR